MVTAPAEETIKKHFQKLKILPFNKHISAQASTKTIIVALIMVHNQCNYIRPGEHTPQIYTHQKHDM